MGVVTTAWLSPSHIVAQTPNYTVQGSCFGYLQLIDPDQLFSFQGPFDFFGAAPLQLGILHAGSLRTGGDHIMISTLTPGFQLPIDANSVLDVKFTNVADPAATSLPCDGVRVFCTFKQGVTFPANYAINDFIDVVTPAVPVSGLYSITIDASGYNSNTLRGAILYSDYKFMDVVNTPYGQARGTIYLQPAPTPQDPSNGYEAVVLPKGWNPLYPCNDSSTQVLSNISGIEGGVAPGTVVADTSSNGVSVDGVFRLDGSGVFAAAVDLPQAPLVGLPSPLNTVHAQPIVLHNAGEPAQVPTVLTSNPQCPF
jgi:hypothetical protein